MLIFKNIMKKGTKNNTKDKFNYKLVVLNNGN
jgi:hypothetical protein